MKTTSVLSAAALCLIVSACADQIPVEPTGATLTRFSGSAALTAEEAGETVSYSNELAAFNNELAAAGSNMRLAKAELIYQAEGFSAVTSTVILANDRARGFGAEWVKGDPRRGGRTGVTYARGSSTGGAAIVRNAAGGFRLATAAELDAQVEGAMGAWRDQSCSDAPMTRVAVTPGTDPDQLDQFFRGQPRNPNYQPPADIVQANWHPLSFFVAIGGPSGVNILGATFSFVFADANGDATDIDEDGNADMALSEIFYNQGYLWGFNGAPGELDFFSILAHESGHALGLWHFGKIFVTQKDAVDDGGIALTELKFAPWALMNAAYVGGRNEIRGTDNSSFCQIWASKK